MGQKEMSLFGATSDSVLFKSMIYVYGYKCNLAKVKIEPVLVASCVFWCHWITPKAHVTMTWGGPKGLAPPLCWRGTNCLCL